MNSKKLYILVGTVIVLFLLIIGFLTFNNERSDNNNNTDNIINNTQSSNDRDSLSLEPNSNSATNTTETEDASNNWDTYSNADLGYYLKYPDEFAPSVEHNDEYNRLTVFGSYDTEYFDVSVSKDTDPDMGVKYGHLGSEVVSRNIVLGGVKGFKAISETGYGDAGAQGKPFVEFAARRNGDMYHLVFYGDAIVSDQEALILSSFNFTK